jgi:hypothetical protein
VAVVVALTMMAREQTRLLEVPEPLTVAAAMATPLRILQQEAAAAALQMAAVEVQPVREVTAAQGHHLL